VARLTAAEVRWMRLALTRTVTRVPDPGPAAGIDRMLRSSFVQFTGRAFRTARFLEARG
jgi:hypothetical protein